MLYHKREGVAYDHVCDWVCPYLLCSKVIAYIDQYTLKHFLEKKDAKPPLIRWILLFQEFNIEI